MVTLKASYTVKPAGHTPTEPMYISDFDQFSIVNNHVPTVYFYQSTAQMTASNTTEILKDSLSKALVMFYPLAGRLQWIDRGRLQLNCNSAGALFFEAESESKIDDFGDFCPSPETKALVPTVNYQTPIHEHPLLLVQVTKFSCGGICLGLAISHVVGDGQSAPHFVSEWARIARGKQPENPPFLDRTILQAPGVFPPPPPRFEHKEFSSPRPLLVGHSDDLEQRQKETTVAILKLSNEQIVKLKNHANNDHNSNNYRAFTRYEAVAAHIWRCSSKARGHKSEQLTSLFNFVNIRNRMNPPLPKWYFGNAILPVVATVASGELLSKPLGFASGKIREAIDKVTDEHVRSVLDFLGNDPDLFKVRYNHVGGVWVPKDPPFLGNPNIDLTTWTHLPLYGVDFGWGNEVHLGPAATVESDGNFFIMLKRNGENSFDFAIMLRLQVAHMDAFKKFFYQDI